MNGSRGLDFDPFGRRNLSGLGWRRGSLWRRWRRGRGGDSDGDGSGSRVGDGVLALDEAYALALVASARIVVAPVVRACVFVLALAFAFAGLRAEVPAGEEWIQWGICRVDVLQRFANGGLEGLLGPGREEGTGKGGGCGLEGRGASGRFIGFEFEYAVEKKAGKQCYDPPWPGNEQTATHPRSCVNF